MGRVFVVQRPGKTSVEANHRWIDKFDLGPARHFGTLVEVLPAGNVPSALGTVWSRLGEVLADFGDDDFLLCLGDPVAIAMAAMVASDANAGRVKVLKWDRRLQEYRPFALDLRTMARE